MFCVQNHEALGLQLDGLELPRNVLIQATTSLPVFKFGPTTAPRLTLSALHDINGDEERVWATAEGMHASDALLTIYYAHLTYTSAQAALHHREHDRFAWLSTYLSKHQAAYPGQQDLHGAIEAMLRLHRTYEKPVRHLLPTGPYELYESVADTAANQTDWRSAEEWYAAAFEKAIVPKANTSKQQLFQLCSKHIWAAHMQGDLSLAIQLSEYLLAQVSKTQVLIGCFGSTKVLFQLN